MSREEITYDFSVAEFGAAGRKGDSERRMKMVEYLKQVFPGEFGIELDETVATALERVQREKFVPPVDYWRRRAYDNTVVPMEYHLPSNMRKEPISSVSQIGMVALMTQLLAVHPGISVAEIGGGSGYQAAVLAEMGAKVVSVERIEEIWRVGQENLERAGYGDRVEFLWGDGFTVLAGPFQGIMVTACIRMDQCGYDMVAKLTEMIELGGRLVYVQESLGLQYLMARKVMERGRWQEQMMSGVAFVPAVTNGGKGLEQ